MKKRTAGAVRVRDDVLPLAALARCLAPPGEAECLPPACYYAESVLEAERETLFRRKWVGIGRADRFASKGEYRAMDLGGVPIIVVRSGDGMLRAFANSCRHRGTRLLDGEGSCKVIRCPFHRWTYALDGKLKVAPQMQDATGFDKSRHGLVEFLAVELCGFAFVCLDDAAPALARQLGDFAALHSPWPLDSLVSTRRRDVEVACNWKAFLDVFNDYYHLSSVHADTIDDVYTPPTPADTVTGEYASQYGETQGTGGLTDGEQQHALPPMPGLGAGIEHGVRYTWVFPNMTFAAGNDALWTYEVHAIDAQRCRATQTICFPAQTVASPDFEERAAHYYHRMDAALAEDIAVLEKQQRGLASAYARQGRFSPLLEASVASFARWYAGQFLPAEPGS